MQQSCEAQCTLLSQKLYLNQYNDLEFSYVNIFRQTRKGLLALASKPDALAGKEKKNFLAFLLPCWQLNARAVPVWALVWGYLKGQVSVSKMGVIVAFSQWGFTECKSLRSKVYMMENSSFVSLYSDGFSKMLNEQSEPSSSKQFLLTSQYVSFNS